MCYSLQAGLESGDGINFKVVFEVGERDEQGVFGKLKSAWM